MHSQGVPTYLAATIQNTAPRCAGVVTALSPNWALWLSDTALPQVEHIDLGLIPEPGAKAIEVTGAFQPLPREDLNDASHAVPAHATRVVFEHTTPEVSALAERERDANLRGQRVVVVDDDLDQLRLMHRVITALGCDPICISASMGAAYVIATVAPRLVVLDVNMPTLEGPALCQHLRAGERTHNVPVLLFSGLPATELAAAAATCGAQGFVEKGAGVSALMSTLQSHL